MPKKYPQNTKNARFGYFFGIFAAGVPEFQPGGYFFSIFVEIPGRAISGVSLCSRSGCSQAWANENISCGLPSIPGIAPGVAPRILGFVLLKSRDAMPRMEFYIREWNFEFRELLREYPGTLRELRGWPFHSESVFPEIGVVSRLLNGGLRPLSAICAQSSTTVHFCGPFGPGGAFVVK